MEPLASSLEGFVENYGYWAILAGTVLEGETVLILGGLAAHQGYLELAWVLLDRTLIEAGASAAAPRRPRP